jgi:hypothetical protein
MVEMSPYCAEWLCECRIFEGAGLKLVPYDALWLAL